MRFLAFAILLACLLLSRCFGKYTEMKVSTSTPLVIEVSGTADMDWIWVQGPRQNVNVRGPEPPKLDDPKKIIIWKIHGPLKDNAWMFVPVSEIPPITYGQLPEGWDQEIPKTGTPPPLLDGYVYYIGLIAGGVGSGANMCVYIKDGKIEPYSDDTGGCSKRR